MGTRSKIGILNEDGTVTSVYCHYDGYLDHNGKILLEHYNDKDRVYELVERGSMSSLGEELHKCDFFTDRDEDLEIWDYPTTKDFLEKPQEYNYLFNPVTKQWFWSHHNEKVMKRLHPEDCIRSR